MSPTSKAADLCKGMVFVPPGAFFMGARADEEMWDPNWPEDYLAPSRPAKEVFVSGFWIDIHPVTYSEYKAFVDATGYPVPTTQGLEPPDALMEYAWDPVIRDFPPELADRPVVLVSWYDAVAYCDWAGKRLPTEAEWEKAARGTDGRPYPWGWDPDFRKYCHCAVCESPEDEAEPAGAIGVEAPYDLAPVDAYPAGASPYGCLDMLGNVREWCADWFCEEYYSRMPWRNPVNQRRTRLRSLRGCGRFWSPPHVALRGGSEPWQRDRGTGFRCVRSARLGEVPPPPPWEDCS